MPALRGGPVLTTWAQVESVDGHAACREVGGKFAGAGADLEGAFTATQQRRQRAGEPARIAHGPIDPTQIATAVERVGMLGRQRVEELGGQGASRHPMPVIARNVATRQSS